MSSPTECLHGAWRKLSDGYEHWLVEVTARVRSTQFRIAHGTNAETIRLCWSTACGLLGPRPGQGPGSKGRRPHRGDPADPGQAAGPLSVSVCWWTLVRLGCGRACQELNDLATSARGHVFGCDPVAQHLGSGWTRCGCDERLKSGHPFLYIVLCAGAAKSTNLLHTRLSAAPDRPSPVHDTAAFEAPVRDPRDDGRNGDAQASSRLLGTKVRHIKTLSMEAIARTCLIK